MADNELLNWLTVREVTRQLDLSQQHTIRLINDGKLRAIRTKLGWLVDPASVAAFEHERAAKGGRRGGGKKTAGESEAE